MADTLNIISTISFVMAVVFAIVAILLWFVFKIPAVIGDLSGRTVKKSIEKMRKNNEESGNKVYKVSEKNLERVKLTSTMQGISSSEADVDETGLLNENVANSYDEQATELLIDESTEFLENSNATESLLSENELSKRKASTVSIELIEETILVHTEEVIS